MSIYPWDCGSGILSLDDYASEGRLDVVVCLHVEEPSWLGPRMMLAHSVVQDILLCAGTGRHGGFRTALNPKTFVPCYVATPLPYSFQKQLLCLSVCLPHNPPNPIHPSIQPQTFTCRPSHAYCHPCLPALLCFTLHPYLLALLPPCTDLLYLTPHSCLTSPYRTYPDPDPDRLPPVPAYSKNQKRSTHHAP